MGRKKSVHYVRHIIGRNFRTWSVRPLLAIAPVIGLQQRLLVQNTKSWQDAESYNGYLKIVIAKNRGSGHRLLHIKRFCYDLLAVFVLLKNLCKMAAFKCAVSTDFFFFRGALQLIARQRTQKQSITHSCWRDTKLWYSMRGKRSPPGHSNNLPSWSRTLNNVWGEC